MKLLKTLLITALTALSLGAAAQEALHGGGTLLEQQRQ